MEFVTHVLPNGLELIAETNPEAYTTAVGFFVRVGSRHEEEKLAGASHFLEHMAFKGTAKRSAEEVNRDFDALGAHYNAFTSEEHTVYYASVLPEQLEGALELLSDILQPALREEDFQLEKQVILEEIQMYEDQPPFGADDKCRALFFGRHPLGRSVLGTRRSISEMTAQMLRAYHQHHYAPNNIVLAAAGRVDFARFVALAERYCGDWLPTEPPKNMDVPQTSSGFLLLEKEAAAQQYLLRLSPAPSAENPRRYAAKLLAVVLGDDSGSRLYWELVDPGLAEQASLSHNEYHGTGAMMTYMICPPDRAADNLQRLLRVYREVESAGVSAAELKQAKNKARSRLVLSAERPRGRLFAIGGDWLYRREYLPLQAELAAVEAISESDIQTLLTEYPLTTAAMITIGPLKNLPGLE